MHLHLANEPEWFQSSVQGLVVVCINNQEPHVSWCIGIRLSEGNAGPLHVQSLERQIKELSQLSRHYNRAVVRAFDRVNGALTSALEARGVWVERVKFSKLEDSYENLAILREGDMITIPAYPELQAEMDVFKSDFTFDGNADYNLQVAQQSGIHALCLVTHDLSAELIDALRRPSVYYNYDPDLI